MNPLEVFPDVLEGGLLRIRVIVVVQDPIAGFVVVPFPKRRWEFELAKIVIAKRRIGKIE